MPVYQKWSKSSGFSCENEHVRIHRRTPRNTTLHHPSTHSDNDSDPKHIKSLHFPHTSGSVSQLFVSCFRHASWQLLVVPGFGDAGVGTSAGVITKDCRWPGGSVRQLSATQERGDPGPRHVGEKQQLLTPELWDAIREGGKWADFRKKNGVKSLHIAPYLPVVCTCLHWSSAQCSSCRTLTSVIVATSLQDLYVICFSDEKSSELMMLL